MMDAMTHNVSNPAATPVSPLAAFSRPAALAGGALALVLATAFATTLIVRGGSSPSSSGTDTAAAAMATSPMALLSAQGSAKTATPQAPMDMPEQASKLPTITEKAESPAKAASPRPSARPAPARTATRSGGATASVCSSCGVVQSVTPVQQKGEGTGVGAVGGAVVGGLLGNQMGGGNGKKAMTVIGAVGGGMAGHEVEKRARGTTVYRVSVRMNDGSIRTVTQATPPTVGQKVTVSGNQVRAGA